MSLLAPIYLLGSLAIGLPILFHLIRRRPKGEIEFSSLMFLQPTPPRLTRRSRLENLPLLLIRALALILLAIAFGRPFMRQNVASDSDGFGRRMVILLDTSASMRRGDAWSWATAVCDEAIGDIQDGDSLAIVAFDSRPTTILSFDQSARLDIGQMKSTATRVLEDLSPTWKSSDLGAAIGYAADMAVTFEPGDTAKDSTDASASHAGPVQLILVSDLQSGCKLESLQVYTWPESLRLDVRTVMPAKTTNAVAQILTDDPADEDDDRVRIRVSNTPDAMDSQFRLSWKSNDGQLMDGTEVPVQVPPGETRVVRMPLPNPNITSLVLQGDDHSFDNQRHVVSPQPVSQLLLYCGPDGDSTSQIDPRESLLYYLSRVPLGNAHRSVIVTPVQNGQWPEELDVAQIPLVTLAQGVPDDVSARLVRYVDNGGNLLAVLSSPDEANSLMASLRQITGIADLSAEEAAVGDYAMLSRIDFSDPVFSLMSDPQFNDFTKIRFWNHRRLTGIPDTWKVLATFDDDDLALVQHDRGEGKIWILASGWQPVASQLALSTKFIPMIFQFFDSSSTGTQKSNRFIVGQPIDLEASPAARIVGPDGEIYPFGDSNDLPRIDSPGVYRLVDKDRATSFAVNLDVAESRTDPLDADHLEQYGVKLGRTPSVAELEASRRQLRDIELESQQKLWQWLLAAALGLLLLETVWGGWLSRTSRASTA